MQSKLTQDYLGQTCSSWVADSQDSAGFINLGSLPSKGSSGVPRPSKFCCFGMESGQLKPVKHEGCRSGSSVVLGSRSSRNILWISEHMDQLETIRTHQISNSFCPANLKLVCLVGFYLGFFNVVVVGVFLKTFNS